MAVASLESNPNGQKRLPKLLRVLLAVKEI